MKKHLVINTLFSLAFIISGPLLEKCGDLADSFSLGAEMVLGMSLPIILAFFILFVMFSISISLGKAILMKDLKQTIPILVFVVFAIMYIALSTQDSFWVRFIEYAKNMV